MEDVEKYYKILGVAKNARQDEIKKAYRKKALSLHPDKNQEDEEGAAAKFQELQEAYETLFDPERRELYDQGVGLEYIDERMKQLKRAVVVPIVLTKEQARNGLTHTFSAGEVLTRRYRPDKDINVPINSNHKDGDPIIIFRPGEVGEFPEGLNGKIIIFAEEIKAGSYLYIPIQNTASLPPRSYPLPLPAASHPHPVVVVNVSGDDNKTLTFMSFPPQGAPTTPAYQDRWKIFTLEVPELESFKSPPPEDEIDILEEYLRNNKFGEIQHLDLMGAGAIQFYNSIKDTMESRFPGVKFEELSFKTLTDKLWVEANDGENVPRTEKEELKREIEELQNIIKTRGIGAPEMGETIPEPEPAAGGEELMRLESENKSLQTENTRLSAVNQSLSDNESEIKERLLELETQLQSKSQETRGMDAVKQELEKKNKELEEANTGLEAASKELEAANTELKEVVDGVNTLCEMTARHKLSGGSRKRRTKRKGKNNNRKSSKLNRKRKSKKSRRTRRR